MPAEFNLNVVTIEYEIFFQPLSTGPKTATFGVTVDTSFFDTQGFLFPLQRTGGAGLDGEGLAVIPLPAALPLYGTGLAVMGFLGWRRKRQALRD